MMYSDFAFFQQIHLALPRVYKIFPIFCNHYSYISVVHRGSPCITPYHLLQACASNVLGAMLWPQILAASHRNESLPRDSVKAQQCDDVMAGSSTTILITAESFPRVTEVFSRNWGLNSQCRLIVTSAQPSSCPDVLRGKYPGTENFWRFIQKCAMQFCD